MNKFKFILSVAIISILLSFHRSSADILSGFYTWTDRIEISTTPVDSTFKVKWEYTTLWSDSLDWYIRFGASSSGIDTADWNSRTAVLVPARAIISFGPTMKLRRMEAWTANGTTTINQMGYKASKQN